MQILVRALRFLFIISVSFCLPASAQRGVPISRNPVKDAALVHNQLFTLPPGDSNFYFRADLPGDNFLVMQFNRLESWPKELLPEIAATANMAWQAVRDSFSSTTAARKLAIHVPPTGFPTLATLTETGPEERTLLLKGTQAQPLRIAVDTLSILKVLSENPIDTGVRRQIQYTFLLKDLSEIENLASDTALINRIGHTFDSLIAAKEVRWKRPNAYYHALEAQYDARPGLGRKAPSLRVNTTGSFINNKFDYTAELGSSLVAGTIAGTGILRLSYFIRSKGVADKGFIALSLSSLVLTSRDNQNLMVHNLSFLNFEVGSVFRETTTKLPLYRTSVGLGYRVEAVNEGPYNLRYRFFFNYSISKAVTLTPEFYGSPQKNNEGRQTFYGLGISLRFF